MVLSMNSVGSFPQSPLLSILTTIYPVLKIMVPVFESNFQGLFPECFGLGAGIFFFTTLFRLGSEASGTSSTNP